MPATGRTAVAVGSGLNVGSTEFSRNDSETNFTAQRGFPGTLAGVPELRFLFPNLFLMQDLCRYNSGKSYNDLPE